MEQKLHINGMTLVFRGDFTISLEDGTMVFTANSGPKKRNYLMTCSPAFSPEDRMVIKAIRFTRELCGCDLKEGKNFVEGAGVSETIRAGLDKRTDQEIFAIQHEFLAFGYKLSVV